MSLVAHCEHEGLIEVRVQRLDELRALWLDAFADGAIFVPALMDVAAGSRVLVHVRYTQPAIGSVFLTGTVAYRRALAGARPRPARRVSGTFAIEPGVAIAFDATVRNRIVFLERLERGASPEARRGPRYPTMLEGELLVRRSESPVLVRIDDVGPHGARIVAPGIVDGVRVGALARLSLVAGGTTAPLAVQVVWVDRTHGDALGARMVLTSAEERLQWARVFSACRSSFRVQAAQGPWRPQRAAR